MATRVAKQPEDEFSPDEIREALESILRSKQFVNAHKRQKFLRLICDFYLTGRAADLNEYTIAYEVFGRGSSYDPSSNPIVRVAAHEIRKKLEIYYQNEGAGDRIRLEIPAGSYQPVFSRSAPQPPTELHAPAHDNTQPTAGNRSLSTKVLAACVAAMALALIALGIWNFQLRRQLTRSDVANDITGHGELWAPFFEDSAASLVVLSNPPVLRLSNPSDPEGSSGESIPLTPQAIEILKDKTVMNPEIVISEDDQPNAVKRKSPPRLILSNNVYTGLGEAIGLSRLTDLFRKANRNLPMKQSRTVNADDLKSRNVILLGGVWVNEWSGKLPQNEDFVFTGNATIENRNPRPGELTSYVPQFDGRTGALMVDYALVTVKPNISDGNKVMVLAGVYSQGTEAAAEFVTNQWYISQLNQRLKELLESGDPHNFQALLKVDVENGIPTTVSLLAFHELR
jgi:hypothetical protein